MYRNDDVEGVIQIFKKNGGHLGLKKKSTITAEKLNCVFSTIYVP